MKKSKMAGVEEAFLIKAATKLGVTGLKASFASNSLSLVLQEAIKRISDEELVEILEKKNLTVIKKHVGVPTTKITVGFETK